MIEIRVICDHAEGPRAKEGKPSNWCRDSVGNDGCTGSHLNGTSALALARTAARQSGYRQTKISPNGKHGWLCPPCYARAYPEKVTDED